MSARLFYSDKFKADAVDLVVSSGRPIAQVARELGVSVTALRRWMKIARETNSAGDSSPDTPVDMAKYRALLAHNRELQREIEFLGKVSAFFASKQQ